MWNINTQKTLAQRTQFQQSPSHMESSLGNCKTRDQKNFNDLQYWWNLTCLHRIHESFSNWNSIRTRLPSSPVRQSRPDAPFLISFKIRIVTKSLRVKHHTLNTELLNLWVCLRPPQYMIYPLGRLLYSPAVPDSERKWKWEVHHVLWPFATELSARGSWD